MHGFGGTHELPWNGPSLPAWGSAVARAEFDDAVRQRAQEDGARFRAGLRARDVERDSTGNVTAVLFDADGRSERIACRRLIVADGVRSRLGRALGRVWHRDTVFGVAARAYMKSARHDDEWITSHLELRDEHHDIVSGYGWVFPLGNGAVNIGVGTLATACRPTGINLRQVLSLYAGQRRDDWGLEGDIELYASAMLPMGGAVSRVAGPNWVLIGDAAACVNPLNGEGIDYGLETGRLCVDLLDEADMSQAWPSTLRRHFGPSFSVARRLAALLTTSWFLPAFGPIGMRSESVMQVALRVMGNLVTDADTDFVARMWGAAGRASNLIDARKPWM